MNRQAPLRVLRSLICLALTGVLLAVPLLPGVNAVSVSAAETVAPASDTPSPAQEPTAIVILLVDRPDDANSLPCVTATPNDCTLRSALKIANSNTSSLYEIYFAADYTINLTASLSMAAGSRVEVYGWGPDRSSRVIKINADNRGSAFIMSGAWNRVADLRIYGAPAGSANVLITSSVGRADIYYSVIGDADPADGCQVGSPNAATGVNINPVTAVCSGCETRIYIVGNTVECNRGSPGNGITVADADRVLIGHLPGGAVSPGGSRNRIRDNAGAGISLGGAKATRNLISYNAIGVTNAGSAAAPNGLAGIYMSDLASSTVITGNVISGNAWAGVWLRNTRQVSLTANLIGTGQSGLIAIPNGHDGVAITDGATGTRLGSSEPAAAVTSRNLISGNAWCGVRIRDGATGNVVDGNWIGLNGAGTAALPNAHAGVCVFSANDNSIGTSKTGVTQFVSGNGREGVYIQEAHGTFVGQSNLVGVASDKDRPLGNGLEGVLLVSATDSTIFPGVVAYNGAAGIALIGSATATGNQLNPVSVFGNRGLPIDLGNDGPTPNDPNDLDNGPNTLLNYPVVTDVNGNQLGGTACPNCTVLVYRAIGHPARPGGGGTLDVGLTTTADAAGVWKLALPSGLTRARLTFQTCAAPCPVATGNTSELSPRPVLNLPLIVKGQQ